MSLTLYMEAVEQALLAEGFATELTEAEDDIAYDCMLLGDEPDMAAAFIAALRRRGELPR